MPEREINQRHDAIKWSRNSLLKTSARSSGNKIRAPFNFTGGFTPGIVSASRCAHLFKTTPCTNSATGPEPCVYRKPHSIEEEGESRKLDRVIGLLCFALARDEQPDGGLDCAPDYRGVSLGVGVKAPDPRPRPRIRFRSEAAPPSNGHSG